LCGRVVGERDVIDVCGAQVMFRRILQDIEGARAAGGQAPGVSVVVRWRHPSFNDTKGTLKKVCAMCDVNASSMLKCSGCNCTYYCSPKCQKEA
jgi:hypothetical protein